MANFYFTEQAEKDLESIIDFTVQRWGAGQAHRYLDDLYVTVKTLAENPLLGARRDELYPLLHSFPYQSHILFYLQQKEDVVIVRVLHANADIARHF